MDEVISDVAVVAGQPEGLRSRLGRRVAIVAGSTGAMMALPIAAFAEDPEPEPISGAITAAVGPLTSSILPVAGVGLGIGATILAVTVGWHLLRRFVH